MKTKLTRPCNSILSGNLVDKLCTRNPNRTSVFSSLIGPVPQHQASCVCRQIGLCGRLRVRGSERRHSGAMPGRRSPTPQCRYPRRESGMDGHY